MPRRRRACCTFNSVPRKQKESNDPTHTSFGVLVQPFMKVYHNAMLDLWQILLGVCFLILMTGLSVLFIVYYTRFTPYEAPTHPHSRQLNFNPFDMEGVTEDMGLPKPAPDFQTIRIIYSSIYHIESSPHIGSMMYDINDTQAIHPGALLAVYSNDINHILAKEPVRVEWECKSATKYTLLFVDIDPEGKGAKIKSEELHWMVANIIDCSIGKGDTISPYKQPTPKPYSGFHRFVYLIYEQEQDLDKTHIHVEDFYNTTHFAHHHHLSRIPVTGTFVEVEGLPSSVY